MLNWNAKGHILGQPWDSTTRNLVHSTYLLTESRKLQRDIFTMQLDCAINYSTPFFPSTEHPHMLPCHCIEYSDRKKVCIQCSDRAACEMPSNADEPTLLYVADDYNHKVIVRISHVQQIRFICIACHKRTFSMLLWSSSRHYLICFSTKQQRQSHAQLER